MGRRPPPKPACAHILLKEFNEEGNLKGKNNQKISRATARLKAGPKQRTLTAKREQRGRRHRAQAASDLSATLARAATFSSGGTTSCVAAVVCGACTSLPACKTPHLSCLQFHGRWSESRASRQWIGRVRIFHVGIAGFHK